MPLTYAGVTPMLPRKAETPGVQSGGILKDHRLGSTNNSLPAPADPRTPRHISQVLREVDGDLTRIHPRAFDAYLDGYQAGAAHGCRNGFIAGYTTRADEEV